MKKKTIVPLIVFLVGICLLSVFTYNTNVQIQKDRRTIAKLNVVTYGQRIENDIEKLLMIAKENNSMIYQERDGINTLLHFYEVQEFHSADKRLSDSEPHDVMSRSNDNYKSIVHQRSVDKGADSLQDEQSD